MMERWFTSDPHFRHANIIRYCHRPFQTVEEMDLTMVQNWNALVAPGDEVWVLGDMAFFKSFHQLQELLQSLNGTKYLVMGNHDKRFKPRQWQEAGFVEVFQHTNTTVRDVPVRLSHYPPGVLDTTWTLHGHVHERFVSKGYGVNVGVDVHKFFPIHEETVHNLLIAARKECHAGN